MKHPIRTLSAAATLTAALLSLASCRQPDEPAPCGPVPTPQQLSWQDMDTYAFIHFSLNTYTDQEWGYGNEPPQLFNPTELDCRQWARVCRQAGMKGIILTAKHHCGFCLWPSDYTDYSVKNTPWRDGKGDVVRELADACQAEGLRFGIYLSPWDRNHPQYGRLEYVEYYRNQLNELLTHYGDLFEVWFDGANGGDGWYGGADEMRRIDRKTYYQWPETYSLIRRLQPDIIIWGDVGTRGDGRWVGTEAGFTGITNWSTLPAEGELDFSLRHHGSPDGDRWVPGEVDVSIRPGWFYHTSEDGQVKSRRELMDIYYKSVGRNATLLLNFPVMPNGRIHPTDSLRALEFGTDVRNAFAHEVSKNARVDATNVRGKNRRYAAARVLDGNAHTYWATDDSVHNASLTIRFSKPTVCNRFVAEEYIALGQRVKDFKLEAFVDGKWEPLSDRLAGSGSGDGLTTIGHRRIVCFRPVCTSRLRFTIVDSKACPLIKRIAVYDAPDIEVITDGTETRKP